MARTGSVSAALLLLILSLGLLVAQPGAWRLERTSLPDAPDLASVPDADPMVPEGSGGLPGLPALSGADLPAGAPPPALPGGAPPRPELGAPVVETLPAPGPAPPLPPALAAVRLDPHDALLLAGGSASGLGLAYAPSLPDPAALAFQPIAGPSGALQFAMQASALDPSDLQAPVLRAAALAGVPVDAAHYAHEEGVGALEASTLRAYAALGLPVSAQQRVDLHDKADAVPLQVAAPAARIIDAITDAQLAIGTELARLSPEDYALLYQCARLGAQPDAAGCSDAEHARNVARTVDRGVMVTSGLNVLSAIEQAVPALKEWSQTRIEKHSPTIQPYDAQTGYFRDPYGLFQIGGFESDTYRGNDLASSTAQGGWDSRVQLLTLDPGGDDTYDNTAGGTTLFVPQPTQSQGNDLGLNQLPTSPQTYVFGALVSVTVDLGGSDTYNGFSGSQGSGALGVGLLVDLGGDDTYSATAASQAYGLTGLGVLIDTNGNDHYGGANLYRGQGFGMFGGIGVLYDVTGSDSYAGQMFVQGAGSTDGLGALLDTGGDDHYDAWTSSAPYAAIAQGASHALATGILADSAGNDAYRLSGGGRGWVYVPMPAPYSAGVGVFYDGAGLDAYTGGAETAGLNGSAWFQGTFGYGKDN